MFNFAQKIQCIQYKTSFNLDFKLKIKLKMGRTESESSDGDSVEMNSILENLEKYRKPDETDREWLLKKNFIEKYHDQFSEPRLICLAQCYTNIESYGCV